MTSHSPHSPTYFLQRAEALKPTLTSCTEYPLNIIRFEYDPNTYLRYKPVTLFAPSELEKRSWTKGEELILDFGTHRTGYFTFTVRGEGKSVGDAPTKIRATFGEVPGDVVEKMDHETSKSWISTAWYPYEVLTIHTYPSRLTLPRRFSFRYVRLQFLTSSPLFTLHITSSSCTSLTSASTPPAPLTTSSPLLAQIDTIALRTLRDCMSTIFEDGPRRDQRLWLRDLRLQALTNYVTFQNDNLVKRCLYLFAAFPRDEGGTRASVWEDRGSGDYILDYDVMFGVVVADYVLATNDKETAHDLWPTILATTKAAVAAIDPTTGAFHPPPDY